MIQQHDVFVRGRRAAARNAETVHHVVIDEDSGCCEGADQHPGLRSITIGSQHACQDRLGAAIARRVAAHRREHGFGLGPLTVVVIGQPEEVVECTTLRDLLNFQQQ